MLFSSGLIISVYQIFEEGFVMKNARENVNCSVNDLQKAKDSLQQALSTVEQDANRKNIESALQSVDGALNQTRNAANNYVESSK